MATNPKIPERESFTERRGPMLVERPEQPTSAVPGVALAIVTAILLLGAIFYFMPRAPKNLNTAMSSASAPADSGPGQLELSGLKMTASPEGGAVNLDGKLSNDGPTEVNGVMAEIDFPLDGGKLGVVQAPVQGIAMGNKANEGKQTDTGKVTGDTESLTKAPIKPGESRAVRITVDQVPSGWNQQMPQVKVAATTGTTAR